MNSQPRPQGLLVFSYGGLAVLQATVPETMPLARLSLHRAPIETPTSRGIGWMLSLAISLISLQSNLQWPVSSLSKVASVDRIDRISLVV